MERAASHPVDTKKALRSFIQKFEPKHQKVIRAARKALRARFPTANELVYDNYNFFVIGYSPTERPSDSVISIAAAANGVGLCFIRGATLSDPAKILHGSGKQTRFLRLPSADRSHVGLLDTSPRSAFKMRGPLHRSARLSG